MDITCEQCQGRFKIPDEKVPRDRAFSITCPKCKNKISIDTRATTQEPPKKSPAPPAKQEPGPEKTVFDEVTQGSYDASDKPFDFVAEGVETSLLCEPDLAIRSKIRTVIENMGYQTTEQESARDALKQMRFHVFDLVVLNERFDTDDPDDCHVIKYLDNLPMVVRRNIFVTLITERFRTMDNMAAFNKSVNLIINLKNIDEFEKILERGITDNTTFYRVYKESLVKTGKI